LLFFIARLRAARRKSGGFPGFPTERQNHPAIFAADSLQMQQTALACSIGSRGMTIASEAGNAYCRAAENRGKRDRKV